MHFHAVSLSERFLFLLDLSMTLRDCRRTLQLPLSNLLDVHSVRALNTGRVSYQRPDRRKGKEAVDSRRRCAVCATQRTWQQEAYPG